ncbi:histone-lysine N-methyltransferase SETD1A-like isoform X2 [Ornithodoros turicata]|uniref:histone-lysine N-methyltransferase SETD1A-like isoform X2 n=1 Tax=Ornithodoros turicata TaxID=34597 RepID=UPI003138AD28
MAETKRRRTELTAGIKKLLCVRFKESPSSHQELAEWAKRELSLDVARSTITTLLKESEKWLNVGADESNSVRARPPKYASLETSLQLWLNDVRARGGVVTEAMFMEQAKVYGALLGIEGFNYSAGWMSRFKSRNRIRSFQVHGEAASVDEDDVQPATLPSDPPYQQGERREGSKRAVPSSWKHFKRMESLLGARAALRELDDSQDTAGDEGTEDSETDRSFVIAPLEGMYADSQEEYIVPTTTDPSMPSTSGTSSADATSLRLSEVRSLADPPSSAQELLSIQIKEEVTDEQMEQESFQQPSRSPPTATVTSTPLVTFPEAISESAPILPPHPVFSTSEPAHLPSLTEPEAQPAIAAPSLDATRPPLEQTTTTGGFNRSRKRPATPWITLSATERKAKVELEILFAQRRKIEAELRKFEADERKVVAETLLLAEEMKRCEEEKKKFKAEAEFFLQEKAKSEEETKKAAAKAALLLEHKNFYVEQQKTEMVRRRMLLLEMRKMKHDLKLLQ